MAAALVAAALGLGATSARAHGGAAVFDTDVAVDGQVVTFDVGITYETDGEPADGAVVRVDGAGPNGERTGPISLERGDAGRYTGSTRLPAKGRWRFTIESAFPPGTTALDVEVPGAADRGQATPVVLPFVAGGGIVLLMAIAMRRRWRRAPVGR